MRKNLKMYDGMLVWVDDKSSIYQVRSCSDCSSKKLTPYVKKSVGKKWVCKECRSKRKS